MAAHGGRTNPLDPNELFSHVEDSPELHVPRVLTADGSRATSSCRSRSNATSRSVQGAHRQAADRPHDRAARLEVHQVHGDRAGGGDSDRACSSSAWPRRSQGGAIARGRFRNMLEAMLLYFRDNVARPCIGGHDADKFVPFLWTIFFFVLALQPVRHDSLDGFADRFAGRHRRAGAHHVPGGDRLRHCRSSAPSGIGEVARAAHGSCRSR